MRMDKIALGTAQFGMDYGINNLTGRIPREEAFRILEESRGEGIDTVDTARGYGDSEDVIGDFISSRGRDFKVVSKLPKCGRGEVRTELARSLAALNSEKIYGYLIHDVNAYEAERGVWEELIELKEEGRIERIGFSLYRTSELERLFDDKLDIDIIQVPYSIFDQRFAPHLSELKKRGVEVHSRSVFLQGLVFKDPDTIGPYFERLKERVRAIGALAQQLAMPPASIYLNFALRNRLIDRVIVGIDNLSQLREVVAFARQGSSVEPIVPRLAGLGEEDEALILPFNWKPARFV